MSPLRETGTRSAMKPSSVLSALLCVFSMITPRSAQAQAPREATPGIVILVEGIGGFSVMGPVGKAALHIVGLPHEVREFRWSHGFGHLLQDLQDTRYFLAKAEELAALIGRLRDEKPDRPIFLVGHSAGTGLVVRAAELAPPGSIDRLVLMSSALSPNYDLRLALAATRRGIVAFHSPYDRVMLDWGTRQFGTVDRFYTRSAGLAGFRIPEEISESDRELYSRLVQIPWSARMILEGNVGQHIGPCFPAFMMAEVAPWLR
jgi:pimeloyl-ACP methyl ester carboxylesterase